MRAFLTFGAGIMLAFCSVMAQDAWRTVDEGGFRITISQDWKRKDVQGIDSHFGAYVAETADLEFTEEYLYHRDKEVAADLKAFKEKEQHPERLMTGEEVWHVDWRMADFLVAKVDPRTYGQRRFANVARLDVPYEGEPRRLKVLIFYKSEADLPVVRGVLRSIQWKTSIDGAAPANLPTFGTAAKSSIRVKVNGLGVGQPGYYFLPQGATVRDAFEAAWGAKDRVAWQQPYSGIIRQKPDGTREHIWFARKTQESDEKNVLQDGDDVVFSHEVY